MLICYLGNVGSGKTEAMVQYCVDHHQDRRILYLVPDHENANEVVTRLESKGVKAFHFGGKNMILDGEGEGDIPFCQQPEGWRYGHCRTCDFYPGSELAKCPYIVQSKLVRKANVVVAVVQRAFLAFQSNFPTIIIDESVQGVLFETFHYTRAQFEEMGIIFDTFPEQNLRMCAINCPLYGHCTRARPGHQCLDQGEMVQMIPPVTSHAQSDKEVFLHKVFEQPDLVIVGARDFFEKQPMVAVFNYLPELPCEDMFFCSATTSRVMIRQWFFKNYRKEEWRIRWEGERPPFANPLFIEEQYGGVKKAKEALEDGTFAAIVNGWVAENVLPTNILIACKLKHQDLFEQAFPACTIRHYPMQGIDHLKHCSHILLTTPFRLPLTARYLIAYQFDYRFVAEMEDGFVIQFIGRLRPAEDSQKVIVTYWNWEHDLFPNRTSLKDERTKAFIREKMAAGVKSANKLFFALQAEPDQDLQRNRGRFLRLVREVIMESLVPNS